MFYIYIIRDLKKEKRKVILQMKTVGTTLEHGKEG